MSWGDVLGETGRPQIGVGASLPPGKEVAPIKRIIYENWSAGVKAKGSIAANDASAGVIGSSGSYRCQEMEVGIDNSLQRMPGVATVALSKSTSFVFQQASLDGIAELIYVVPPFIGVRSNSTVAPTFTNVALNATPANGYWNAANVAGELILSNGADATYTKQPGVAAVVDITAQIKAASTFATAFGRVFAGAYVDAVTGLQGLGIRWNAANGLLADWTGTGADAELLISNSMHADRIVALRPLGFEALVILCRHSVWLGYKTDDPNRPVDFQERYTGFGCIYEATAVSTPFGVVYLSDSGVLLVTATEVKNLSVDVNAVLQTEIPTTIGQQANATFDSNKQRYILNLPSSLNANLGTQWCYDFPLSGDTGNRPGRWYYRTPNIFIKTVNFSFPSPATTESVWYLLGRNTEGFESDIGIMGPAGSFISPIWTCGEAVKDPITEDFTAVGYEIEYSLTGASFPFKLLHYTGAGFGNPVLTVTLLSTGGSRKILRVDSARLSAFAQGTVLQLRMDATGDATGFKLYRITALIIDAGPGLRSALTANVAPG